MDREQVKPPIRVAVAAPFPQIVGIHRRAAEYADEIELCAAISDATRVLEQARLLQPEVLLLSEDLGFDDAEFFTQLTAVAPTTRLVMLVGDDRGARGSFADAVLGSEAVAGELRSVIVAAARRIDVDTAPAAHSRSGLEPDETRWFSEMHDPGPQTATRPSGAPPRPSALPADQAERRLVPASTPAETSPPAADTAPQAGAGGVGAVGAGDAEATPERLARTVLVFSGKGGVGKSVVATNLATALTVAGLRVALVDLNLQYGDAGVLFHLEAHPTSIDGVAAAATAGRPLDAAVLDAALATTPEGLRVLLAPRSPEHADLVTAAGLGAILTELGRSHDYVVVDSPAHLEERILGVMEVADHVLLVTSSNITALKDTKMTLRLLQSLGIEPDRVAVVLNQTRARISFAAEDIERALHFPLLAKFPYEPRMDESIDNGRPIVLSEPRSGFNKQLQLVVDRLSHERAASARRMPRERPRTWRLRFNPR